MNRKGKSVHYAAAATEHDQLVAFIMLPEIKVVPVLLVSH